MSIWSGFISLVLLSIGLVMIIPYTVEMTVLLFSRKKRRNIERYVLIMASIGWAVLATHTILFKLDNSWYWISLLTQIYLVYSTLKSLKDLNDKDSNLENFVININYEDKNSDPQELVQSISQALRKESKVDIIWFQLGSMRETCCLYY